MEPNFLEQILEGSMKPTHIPLQTLWKVTGGFSTDRIIGEGGFGTVYKGIVGHWIVAVKKIRSSMTIDEKHFHREVDSLMKVNHPNIVRFLGLCSHTVEIAMEKKGGGGYIFAEKRERLLCFEYINNGSLDTKITGYCAPENMVGGRKTTMSDMYSLGVIIIELVTGHKGIPDKDNILRRWRHRWKQSAKKMPLEYHQQVTKCIEIGSFCRETDPFARPSISKVMKFLQIGSTYNHTGNAYESTAGQINAPGYWEDDMLGVEPLELQFGYNKEKQILSCSIELSNDTNGFIAYKIQKTSPLPYSIHPEKEIMKPRSKYRVDFSLRIANTHDHAATRQYSNKLHNEFTVRSFKVNEGLTIHDVEDILDKNSTGCHVDEIHLAVVCEEQCSKEDKVMILKVRPRLRRVDEDIL